MIPLRVSTRTTLPLLLVLFGAPNTACLASASSWLEGSAERADAQTAARTERKRTRAALEVGTRYELWPLAYVIHRVVTAPLLEFETMQEAPKQQYAIVAFDFTVENISDAPYRLPTGSMKLTASPWEFTTSIDAQLNLLAQRETSGSQTLPSRRQRPTAADVRGVFDDFYRTKLAPGESSSRLVSFEARKEALAEPLTLVINERSRGGSSPDAALFDAARGPSKTLELRFTLPGAGSF